METTIHNNQYVYFFKILILSLSSFTLYKTPTHTGKNIQTHNNMRNTLLFAGMFDLKDEKNIVAHIESKKYKDQLRSSSTVRQSERESKELNNNNYKIHILKKYETQ